MTDREIIRAVEAQCHDGLEHQEPDQEIRVGYLLETLRIILRECGRRDDVTVCHGCGTVAPPESRLPGDVPCMNCVEVKMLNGTLL